MMKKTISRVICLRRGSSDTLQVRQAHHHSRRTPGRARDPPCALAPPILTGGFLLDRTGPSSASARRAVPKTAAASFAGGLRRGWASMAAARHGRRRRSRLPVLCPAAWRPQVRRTLLPPGGGRGRPGGGRRPFAAIFASALHEHQSRRRSRSSA